MVIKFNKQVFNYGVLAFAINIVLFFVLSLNFYVGVCVLLCVFFALIKQDKLFYSFFIQAIFFQNMFIAFFSDMLITTEHFKLLHGVNFIIPLLLLILIFKNSADYFNRTFYVKSIIVIGLLMCYFLFGLANYGLINSMVYLRMFLIPIMFFLIGIYFSKRITYSYANKYIFVAFVLCGFITFFQFLFPLKVSYLLNDLGYFRIKWGVSNWQELLDLYKSKKLFNISWFDIRLSRIGSLIKSIISLGYFLTILAIYFYLPQKKTRLSLIAILVIVSVNSKGAILVLLYCSLLYFLFYKSNLSKPLAISLYVLINIGFIFLGYNYRNEHIVGFFHGMEHLFSFGNGLGFGGNLSSSRVASFNGETLQDLGYWTRFQNGSESVFGVLFSSLGIFSLVYIYYFVDIIKTLYNMFTSNVNRMNVLKVLTVVLFVQGVYQEEAFSPYAFGLVMFLVGLNFDNSDEREITTI